MHATPIILMKFMFSFADSTIPKRKSIATNPSFLFIVVPFIGCPALAGGAVCSLDCVFGELFEVVNCRVHSFGGVGEKLFIATGAIVVAALAVVLAAFFVGLLDFPVDADYSVNVSRAGSVHVEVVCDVKLLLVSHHIIEDFEEVEAEVCGVHFVCPFILVDNYIIQRCWVRHAGKRKCPPK